MLGLSGLGQAGLAAFPPVPPPAVAVFRNLSWHAPYGLLGIRVASGHGGVIRPGVKGLIRVPADCVIERMVLVADQACSLVVDIQRSALPQVPQNSSETIVHDRPPTLSNQQSIADFTLLDWDTHLSANDVLRVVVVSASALTNFTLGLMVDHG